MGFHAGVPFDNPSIFVCEDYAIARPLYDRLILLLLQGAINLNAMPWGLPLGIKKLFKANLYGLKRFDYFLRIG